MGFSVFNFCYCHVAGNEMKKKLLGSQLTNYNVVSIQAFFFGFGGYVMMPKSNFLYNMTNMKLCVFWPAYIVNENWTFFS